MLFTSGYAENVIMHQGRLEPASRCCKKPYRRVELAAEIRRGAGRQGAGLTARRPTSWAYSTSGFAPAAHHLADDLAAHRLLKLSKPSATMRKAPGPPITRSR